MFVDDFAKVRLICYLFCVSTARTALNPLGHVPCVATDGDTAAAAAAYTDAAAHLQYIYVEFPFDFLLSTLDCGLCFSISCGFC